jgi:DNA recombination protein RmuC
MDWIFIVASIIFGLIFGFFISKSFSVSKNIYEKILTDFNELQNKFSISSTQLENEKKNNELLTNSLTEKNNELQEIRKEFAVIETQFKHQTYKIQEIQELFQQEKELNGKQQTELLHLKEINTQISVKHQNLEENLQIQKQTNIKQENDIKILIENVKVLSEKFMQSQTLNQTLNDNLNKQKEEIEQIQKTAHLEFEKIANKILEEKTEKFTKTNQINIETLLKPLGENLDGFKKKVEEVYINEAKQRFSLEERVKELVEQTNKVSAEANNLAKALKGETKKQGNWGEEILERILENTGLSLNIHYTKQETIIGENGQQLRPDILVKLPENRVIIIDSKVSLTAYERFSSAENTEEQQIHLAAHLQSIYQHINDLSGKKYDDLETSLDFTMMFIPIEPAYLIAIQQDQNLWNYAHKKRILLISPTNLIACLKIISDLWKRELQSKNAMEIVRKGELMYEKFVNFAETMDDLGKSIEKTNVNYQKAINQLNTGKGNLASQAIQLKKLGLKSSKELPNNLLPLDEEI